MCFAGERSPQRPDIVVDHAQFVRDKLMVKGYGDETGARASPLGDRACHVPAALQVETVSQTQDFLPAGGLPAEEGFPGRRDPRAPAEGFPSRGGPGRRGCRVEGASIPPAQRVAVMLGTTWTGCA
jgi:hypothetical protein